MEGVVNVEWHGQDYLHLRWHVVCSGLATPDLDSHPMRARMKLFQYFYVITVALIPHGYIFFKTLC